MDPGWTTPEDVRLQAERWWNSGRLLAAKLQGRDLFPLNLVLRKPGPKDLAERFDEVRAWIRRLEEASKARRGFGYEVQWVIVNHRQLGRNRFPSRLLLPSEADALALIGKTAESEVFLKLAERSLADFPQLQDWLASHPLTVIQNAAAWEQMLPVLAWFRDNPRSGRYARQIDLPGIDTKFIETRAGLLAELLAAVGADISSNGQPASFEQRFGLISKPPLIRFRLLDESLNLNGFADLAVPASDFARFAPPAERVFITENEINGLTFPQVRRGLVIFGLGYGLERLTEAAWLGGREVYYWGDIDTHGFAMLDRLRAAFPHARSFLMDRSTLLLHRDFWVTEPEQFVRPLPRLDAAESSLYRDLAQNRLGERVRLEQERIRFGMVADAVQRVQQA